MSDKYNLRTMTFKGDGVHTCICCEAKIKKTNVYGEACSSLCAKELAELKAVPLPVNFVISLVNRTRTEKEKETQLRKFIKMHNLDEKKVFMKFNEMVTRIKKDGISSLRRKPLIAC